MITNVILVIPLIWGFYKGFRKGLIVELASILAIILGVYACSKFSDVVANFLGANLHTHLSSLYLSVISVAIVFIGILILVFFIAKRIQKVAEALFLGIANRILGGIFGAFKWAFLISVFLYLFDILNAKAGIVGAEVLRQSWVYTHLILLAPLIMPTLLKSKAKLLI
jgi:membrane protein required for colicin V production